jgi:hypothetical protein
MTLYLPGAESVQDSDIAGKFATLPRPRFGEILLTPFALEA